MKRREEDYLRAVYELERGAAVSPGELAARLGVSGAAVTRMTQRLANAGLLRRVAYQGVRLTERGRHEALRIVRHYRLAEVFLVNLLGYPWDQLEAADELEHAFTPALAERLMVLLGHPTVCPHGHPIPTAAGTVPAWRVRPLNTLAVGQSAQIRYVVDHPPLLREMARLGLRPGVHLRLVGRTNADGALIVESAGQERLVPAEVAAAIFVSRLSDGAPSRPDREP